MHAMTGYIKKSIQRITGKWKTRGNGNVSWLLVISLFIISSSVSCAQSGQGDAKWLIKALNIKEGSVVAEIGAGNGRMTIAMAKEVGPSGKVYTSELGADSVEYLRDAVNSAEVSNTTVVEGHPMRTNFPEACCDALFMRRVYHHFDDPAAMNKSIWQALKPGGRLAIIDFEPRGTESSDAGGRDSESFQHHGVSKENVIEELRSAGFTLVNSEEGSDRNIYIVMQKQE